MRSHRVKAFRDMAYAEALQMLGFTHQLRPVDEATVRELMASVLDRLNLTDGQRALAREALAEELAARPSAPKRAKQRAPRRKPKRTQPDESAAEPTAEEEAALDRLVHPTVIRRKKKSNRKEGSR